MQIVVRKEWLHSCGYRQVQDDVVMSVRRELGRTPSGCMMYEVDNPVTGREWVVAEWRLVACEWRAR